MSHTPNSPDEPWEIFIIQHSHVDLGFTDRQEVIRDYHRQFLGQATQFALETKQAARPADARFKFTCESSWAVDEYIRGSTKHTERLKQCIANGDIELTAFYLHLTELLDQGHLDQSIESAKQLCDRFGVPLTCAMACDINGMSWGMADSLIKNGVKYLISNLNTHHGGFPAFGPLNAFYWEAPAGGKLLVWNGLPYHKANLLGLMGGWTPDSNPGIPGVAFEGSGEYIDINDISFAERALPLVLKHLESTNYPYRFLPLMGSGLYTDNSPPSDKYCDIIQEWNTKHRDRIHIQSATLAEYFAHLELNTGDIQTYRGDWPDWWSDGVASAPLDTILFRNAQRSKRLAEMLDPDMNHFKLDLRHAAGLKLIEYAEHTFGYSNTQSSSLLSNQIFKRKSALAVDADQLAMSGLDAVLTARGASGFTAARGYAYKIINPLPVKRRGYAKLPIDWWEASPFFKPFTVLADGKSVPYQLEQDSRGWQVYIVLEMDSDAEIVVELIKENANTTDSEPILSGRSFINEFYEINWSGSEGITSLISLPTEKQLIDQNANIGLGAPIYQLFKGANRGDAAGFNLAPRTIPPHEKFFGKCTRVETIASGPIFKLLKFTYEVPGTESCSLVVRLFNELPQIELCVQMVKTNVRDPEGMYIGFPVEVNGGIWHLDKPGGAVRPGIDQIPGTCCDYYCIQDGAAYCGTELGVGITTLDAPLVHIGDMRLWQYNTTLKPTGWLYSWVTNNKWDCNFPIYVGGNFEFRYVIEADTDFADASLAMNAVKNNAVPLVVVRTS